MKTPRSITSRAAALSAALLFLFAAYAAPACSRIGPFKFDELMVADVIVRAAAVGYVGEPDLKITTTGVPKTEVEFEVEEVLRGDNVPERIVLNGYVSDKNDFNELPVPYTFVRRNGRSGSCFANTYKKGGEFLLFLRKTDSGYTSNISALGPSNEQVKGSDDEWVEWVRAELKSRGEN